MSCSNTSLSSRRVVEVLAGPHQPGSIHASQKSLLAQTLQGMGGPLAHLAGSRVGQVADLLVHVVEDLLFQGCQGRLVGPVAQDD
ncbi:MAG: hypothetical protein ACOX9B_15210 [Candidatus Xenobium sp.]